jgi:hypothetical protein
VATVTPSTMQELVPIADRIRFMQLFRIVAGAFVLLAWITLPDVRVADPVQLLAVTGGYLGLSIVSEAATRRLPMAGLTVFSSMLIVDALYLGWLSYVSGGAASPLRPLILLHLIAVALLACSGPGSRSPCGTRRCCSRATRSTGASRRSPSRWTRPG